MRCNNCNKFVSYDEPEAEAQSVEVSCETVTADVRVVLKCQECGDELKDYEFNVEQEFEHTCKPEADRDPNWKPAEKFDPETEDKFELESDGEPESTSRMQTEDKNGKRIKNPRYMKTFYGFELQSEVKCRCCGEVFAVDLKDEAQASSFNELQ